MKFSPSLSVKLLPSSSYLIMSFEHELQMNCTICLCFWRTFMSYQFTDNFWKLDFLAVSATGLTSDKYSQVLWWVGKRSSGHLTCHVENALYLDLAQIFEHLQEHFPILCIVTHRRHVFCFWFWPPTTWVFLQKWTGFEFQFQKRCIDRKPLQ